MRNFILNLCLGLGLFACTTQEVCDGDGQSEMVVRFKTTGTGSVTDTILAGVTIFGIRSGLADSLLYNNAILTRMVLPLDTRNDYSNFVLRVNDVSDTLTINQSNEFYLLSYSCGFAARFNLNGIHYTGSIIQDYEIINSVIDAETEQNEEHLWLYF